MKRSIFLLLAIIVVAAFLRFWQLGKTASSLTWDEVAWGYNAYSLGIDGKDEFGDQLANGVYIYRVISSLNGNAIDKRETSADKYFVKGYPGDNLF